MVTKVWPFSEALATMFLKSFLELEVRSARTAETLLSMLILIRGVLAEALSEQLKPGTCVVFSVNYLQRRHGSDHKIKITYLQVFFQVLKCLGVRLQN